MRLYNIKHKEEKVSFKDGVIKGMGSDDGLYFPESLPYFENMDFLLSQDFIFRSCEIMKQVLKEELPSEMIEKAVRTAFHFPIQMKKISHQIFALELFWGPTFAFKDFGARFMAQILRLIAKDPITIVTATSGDTGAAIAHAFKGIPNIQVAILYPYQRISPLQEKLFCTLGDNIYPFAVQGSFDDCQALVKRCFADKSLALNINSGNSINISRVLAQSLYYFEAVAALPIAKRQNVVIAVPSGNFGNLTAGLFARQMGLPVSAFVAATNANDTVPRYLENGIWAPHKTIATLSNAMDVSLPNNWPRIETFFSNQKRPMRDLLRGIAVNEDQTKQAILELHDLGYIADPHSAIAYYGLKSRLKSDEVGVFLCTAHHAKFKESVEDILQMKVVLPQAMAEVEEKPLLSKIIANDYQTLVNALYAIKEKS